MPKPPSGHTAETLALVTLIIQGLFTLIILLVFVFLGAFFFAASLVAGFTVIGLIIVLIVLLLALFFLYAGYAWVYTPVKNGNYEGASTWALILGIIGLLTSIIVGILYLVTWVKIRDAANERRSMMMPGQPGPMMVGTPPAPMPPQPYAPPAAPMHPAAGAPGAVPTCPRCHNPGTWVPQYSRYYCYTCGQYL